MNRPGGYVLIVSPDAPTVEHDTFTCCHCQNVVFVKPKAPASESGGWCARCSKPVCGGCAGKECTPFEKRLEQVERAARTRREYDAALAW